MACAPSERVRSRGVAASGDSASELFAACRGPRPPPRSSLSAATRIPRRLRPGRGGGAAPRGGGGAESGAGLVESWDGVRAGAPEVAAECSGLEPDPNSKLYIFLN